MAPKTKKIVTALAILATVGITGLVVYKVVKHHQTKSKDPKKQNRKIIFTK